MILVTFCAFSWPLRFMERFVKRGVFDARPLRLGCTVPMRTFLLALLLAALHLHAQPNPEPPAEPGAYLAELSTMLTWHWPTNRTVNIVCHGHSVPAGYFKTPLVDTFNAYPHLLHRGLKERFPCAVINVIVTAIGGEDSESGAKRFERYVLPLRPQVVTIDYSLNDRGIGLARAETAWRAMLTNAAAHGIKVILLTPTPDLAARLDDPNDPLAQHADQVRRLAREYHVGLVDSLAAFRRAVAAGRPLTALMSQPNHPNRQGHELVAAELLRWFPTPSDKP
jgi:acyl-CoA thioesterase-1